MNKFAILSERKSLSDRAYEAIFQRIVSGQVQPGERLNEFHIAAQMGVSRAPVREAIQRLRQKGLVTLVPGRGPTVIALSTSEIREVYGVRVALELAAIDAIAPEHCASLAEDLSKIIESIKTHARNGQVAKVVDEEIHFHEVIVAAAKNALLSDFYNLLVARLRMILAVDKSAFVDLEEVGSGHEEIVDSIARNDRDQVKQLISEHIWSSLPIVEMHPAFSGESREASKG